MVKFEGQERRMPKINACLAEYGMASLEDARAVCLDKGIDVEKIVKGVQPTRQHEIFLDDLPLSRYVGYGCVCQNHHHCGHTSL